MEAAPVNIIQYFDGSKQGIIPLFQRPYSWERKDWQILWDDLMAQYNEKERSSHFMGAVVTVPVKSVPVGVAKHLVIDGQQRLTTLSILLAAIRDCAESTGDPATAGIIGDLLVNRHYKAPDDLKLMPTQADRSAYYALIHKKELEPHDESKIIQAYSFFVKQLDGFDIDENALIPSWTLHAIQQSLQVVMINLSEADDPYLIFESLNHKGKPLNQADLVRNYVLMRFQHSSSAGGEQEVIYEDFWRPMEASLNSSMTEFLRHYGMRHGRNVRKDDIYTASKSQFKLLEDVDEVRKELGEMKLSARAYAKFLKPIEEPNEAIAKRLRGIQELDSTVFYPLLMRLYREWELEALSSEELVHCLDMLESFYVRRLICSVPTNGLNKITVELCLNFPVDNFSHWLRERLLKGSAGSRWPTDQEFATALVTERIYPRRRIARYLLSALEESYEHKEPVDTESATIEHVMPQTLSDEWVKQLGPEYSTIHDQWLDTIGNLTLTGYNSELGNSSFDEKKAKLQNTHYELSKSLLTNGSWGAAEMKERGQMLAQRAVDRWNRE